jgi:hypothetical protein
MIYTFAKNFGWSVDQIMKTDNVTLRHLMWIIDEVAREEERQAKNNRGK